jgi:hypothetical protein
MASAAFLASLLVVAADHMGERHWGQHDIHRFTEHDLKIWQDGYWINGNHDDRTGWWLVAAGIWYLYPAPAYFTTPEMINNQQPTISLARHETQFWYYCDS